ncbi:MAG: acylphosphatase [Bdellovibrionales bacterium]|nr:acylphosphatase [Bdellovibrionales bacterium]
MSVKAKQNENKEMEMFQAVVKGKVQGVSYRWSAEQLADSLHIRGWVQNQPDGSVSIYATGHRENVEDFFQWIKKGPPASEVRSVDIQWGKTTEEKFSEFSILS